MREYLNVTLHKIQEYCAVTTLISCTSSLCSTAASLVERGHGAQRVRPLRQEEERKEGEEREERKEGEEVKRCASPSPLSSPPPPPPTFLPYCGLCRFAVATLHDLLSVQTVCDKVRTGQPHCSALWVWEGWAGIDVMHINIITALGLANLKTEQARNTL